MTMIAEILCTGDEVRSGALVDSNSAHISQKLEEAGLEVTRHTCVGDNLETLEAVMKEIGNRADIAVATGGLGPTTDDLTTEAAAKAAGGLKLILDERALGEIEAFFNGRKRVMTPSNRKQAMLPQGADILYNPVGTAPGFGLKIGKCLFFFLPGVPYEMKKMLSDQVLPRIEKLQGRNRSFCKTRTISTFGLTESGVGETVADLSEKFPGIRLGLRANFPEIQIKLYAAAQDETWLDAQIEKASAWVSEKIGHRVISLEGHPMEAAVGNLLRQRGETLAVAESCTGGLISHWLTNVSGSSDYFLFSAVSYSNESKMKVLGVSQETLEQYGAVHEETAKEMAEGVRRLAGATYGIATSGIAGPTGGTDEKPVGTVCIGIASPEGATGRRFNFGLRHRAMNKSIFAMSALDLLRLKLMN